MADIPEEHLTEELLDRLLASASIEQYLDEGLVSARTLTDSLFDRMEAHDLRRADVVRASGQGQATCLLYKSDSADEIWIVGRARSSASP